jgi:hypothetical protein
MFEVKEQEKCYRNCRLGCLVGFKIFVVMRPLKVYFEGSIHWWSLLQNTKIWKSMLKKIC